MVVTGMWTPLTSYRDEAKVCTRDTEGLMQELQPNTQEFSSTKLARNLQARQTPQTAIFTSLLGHQFSKK
jgi:hypothetical protein